MLENEDSSNKNNQGSPPVKSPTKNQKTGASEIQKRRRSKKLKKTF